MQSPRARWLPAALALALLPLAALGALSKDDNAYKEYLSGPDARQELIEGRVAAWVESIASDDVPLDPKNIVPIIKDRERVAEAQAMSKARGLDPDESQVTEDYNDELVIVYAEDTPRNVRYFTSKDPAKAGVERSKKNAEGIARLRDVADQLTAEGTYTISSALFVYRKGKFRRFEN